MLSSLIKMFERKHYRRKDIPADLPVEIWMIYLQLPDRIAFRLLEFKISYGQTGYGDKLVVPLVCTRDNPLVLVTVYGGTKKALNLTYDKATFIENWGIIHEMTDHQQAIDFLNGLCEFDKDRIAILSNMKSITGKMIDSLGQMADIMDETNHLFK